jgi:hypothetical protein
MELPLLCALASKVVVVVVAASIIKVWLTSMEKVLHYLI